MSDNINWQDDIELDFKNAIILTCKGEEYELLNVFQWDNSGKYYIDCDLMEMAAKPFDPANYDKLALVEKN